MFVVKIERLIKCESGCYKHKMLRAHFRDNHVDDDDNDGLMYEF